MLFICYKDECVCIIMKSLFCVYVGFETSKNYTLECNVRLEFDVNDTHKCYYYNITDDDVCELQMRARTEVFKVLLTLVATSDFPPKVTSSHSVANVYINDSAEPECCESWYKIMHLFCNTPTGTLMFKSYDMTLLLLTSNTCIV